MMCRFICLECEDREVFLNLDQILEAEVAVDSVSVHFAGGELTRFSGIAAHELVQALRHEERKTAQVG